jgi:formylglycine-generating enzyme
MLKSTSALPPPGGAKPSSNAGRAPRRFALITKDVALKAPNQLGLYDLSGNVWEWCEDTFTPSVADLPSDGRPHIASGPERVLRGGCFHNWAMHCTGSKRYAIASDAHDGCIGLRLAFA